MGCEFYWYENSSSPKGGYNVQNKELYVISKVKILMYERKTG